ncbi:MAG: xanthine dehydrogenase family protein subunit M [Alphaproteobacteria bacterium]|nr:xanthine dehydrogenase family protein subunit M [Alphaproteobacteria bacterium]
MKPAPFALAQPDDLAGVLAALARHGEAARVLAGGQSLVPLMNLRLVRPAMLVSINRCAELAFTERRGDRLVLGALVRQAEAETHPLVRAHCPLLAAALPWLGPQATRNRGTLCGSLAHADPLAELPAVALALEADMLLASQAGERRLPASEFFQDALTTVLRPGEMVRAVAFQAQAGDERSAFLEIGNREHGFAVAGVAVRWRLEAERCAFARIAMLGAGPVACRVPAAEAAIVGRPLDAGAIAEVVEAARAAVAPPTDVHADADYRRHALGVLLARALRQGDGQWASGSR